MRLRPDRPGGRPGSPECRVRQHVRAVIGGGSLRWLVRGVRGVRGGRGGRGGRDRTGAAGGVRRARWAVWAARSGQSLQSVNTIRPSRGPRVISPRPNSSPPCASMCNGRTGRVHEFDRSALSPYHPRSRGGAAAARRAHNPKVGGSNPSPATNTPSPEPRARPPGVRSFPGAASLDGQILRW